MKSVRYILSILTFSLFLTIKPETNSTPPTPAAPADVHVAEKQPATQAQASAPAAQEKQAEAQQLATQKTEPAKTASATPTVTATTQTAKKSEEKSDAKASEKTEEKSKAPIVPKEPAQITPEDLLTLYVWAGVPSKVQQLLDANPKLNVQAIKGKMGNSLMTIAAYNFFMHDKAAISSAGIFSNEESQIRDRYLTIMRALKARGATYNATLIAPDNNKFTIPEHKSIKALLAEKINTPSAQDSDDAKKPNPITKDQLLVLYTWAGNNDGIKELLTKNSNLKVQDIADETTVAPKATGNSPLLIAAFNFITHDVIIQKAKDTSLKTTETTMRDKYGAIIKDLIQRGAEYHPTYKSEIGAFDLPKNKALDALVGKK